MFSNEGLGDVYSGLTLHALRCPTTHVEFKDLCAFAQKLKALSIADAYKKVWIQRERFGPGKGPKAAPVRIAKLDFVRGAADDFQQLLTMDLHI